MNFLCTQHLSGAVTVTAPPAAPFTEAQADQLAHAGASFDIVKGRAVQTMRMEPTGYSRLDGLDESRIP